MGSPSNEYLFAVLSLILVHPIAIEIALLGSRMDWLERLAAAWFVPKGFATVVYGLLILKARLSEGEHLFHLTALVIVLSIVAHSSTDVFVARWFRKEEEHPEQPRE